MSWHFGNQFENPPSCCKLFFKKVNFLNQVCGMVLWRGGGQGGVWERKKGVGGGEGRGAIVSGRVERQEPGPPRDHPDRRSNTTTSLLLVGIYMGGLTCRGVVLNVQLNGRVHSDLHRTGNIHQSLLWPQKKCVFSLFKVQRKCVHTHFSLLSTDFLENHLFSVLSFQPFMLTLCLEMCTYASRHT